MTDRADRSVVFLEFNKALMDRWVSRSHEDFQR